MDLKASIEQVLSVKNWSAKRSSEEVKLISSVYRQAFDKKLRVTCGTCIIEAYFELKDLYQNQLMLNQKTMGQFKLKPNKIIQLHGQPDAYTNANMTDEKAIEILRLVPSHIKTFEEYPENWQELTTGVKAKTPKVVDEVGKNDKKTKESKNQGKK